MFGVVDNQPVAKVSGHTGQIDKASLTPDGAMALTVGRDGTARLWRTTPDTVPILYPGYGSVSSARIIAGSGRPIAIVKHPDTKCGAFWRAWHIDTGAAIGPALISGDDPEAPLNISSISADGSTLVAGNAAGPFVVIDFASGRTTAIAARPNSEPSTAPLSDRAAARCCSPARPENDGWRCPGCHRRWAA
ncbi:hypothetical protein [Mesorhizobium japonicum]|uniref:hypothetical protein n=1 Tax=Mesorhizobium japonicum TaxID=2066070 RepID=UPI003CC8054C